MKYKHDFIYYLEKDKLSSTSTVNAYLSDLKEFEEYMKAQRSKDADMAGNADVAAFLMYLKSEGRSGSTINRKLASVRSYFSFVKGNGKIKDDPTANIKAPRQKRKDLEFLTVEEVELLLEQPDESIKGLRDKALLELMYATGMKAGEVVQIVKGDVELRIGFVSCSAENSKTRIIPLGKPARNAVKEYLEKSRPVLLKDHEDCGALFLNYMGEAMTRQGIWKILKFYGEKAGLEKTLSPHILRNSFAAHMIQNGADLKSLQELMGHEDITATKVFLSLSKNRIMDVYDKAFPRA